MTKTKLRMVNLALFVAAGLLFSHGYVELSFFISFAMG